MAITRSMIETAIESMPNDFDSHDVIRAVAQRNQRAYAEALIAIDGDLLFHKLHTNLGRQIAEICDDSDMRGSSPEAMTSSCKKVDALVGLKTDGQCHMRTAQCGGRLPGCDERKEDVGIYH